MKGGEYLDDWQERDDVMHETVLLGKQNFVDETEGGTREEAYRTKAE